MPETRIKFPDPSKLGLFFGPKGKTIKDLQDRTNTRITVENNVVIIRARDQGTLDKAVLVVQNKINTLHAGYSHPEVAYSVLMVPAAYANNAMFQIEPYQENATSMIATHKKLMFVPNLVPMALPKKTDDVEQLLANLSLTEADTPVVLKPSQFICSSNETGVVNALAKEFAAVAIKEYQAQNGKTIFFDAFSLRVMVSLGKVCLNAARNTHPMFYNGTSISASNLCKLQVGLEKDFKMTYMPIISAERAKLAELYLNDAKYNKKEVSPVIASVHCQNQDTSCNYTVTLLIDSKSNVITLKKICTEALKPLFCQMIQYTEQGGATTVDSRIRIDTECKSKLVTSMASVNSSLPDAMLKAFLSGISWNATNKELVIPKIANFAIDTIRYKQCNVFVKDGIKASISRVREHGAIEGHVELTIKCQKIASVLALEPDQVKTKIANLLYEAANIQKSINK